MRERGVAFGPRSALLGVVTEPPATAKARRDTAVVLLNAGFLHRIGPNRLYVRIARELAAAGFWVIRFDFSGLGDSQPRYDKTPLDQAVTEEAGAAMDVLSGLSGVDRFIVAGLCSGADNSLRAAVGDERVVGIGLIDFYYEPSFDYYLNSCRRLFVSVKTWGRLLRGKSEVLGKFTSALSNFGAAKKLDQIRTVPKKELMIEGLQKLAARGVNLCFVFSVNGPAHFHFKRTFARPIKTVHDPARVRVEVIRNTDHVFTKLSSQEELLRVLVGWAQSVPAASKLQTA